MKKLFSSLIILVCSSQVFGQSFQWHQSWDQQKMIVDYYWTSQDNAWNIFSWNEFQVGKEGTTSATALLYAEYKLGKSNFYLHPEIRLNTAWENYYYFGFAYRIPFKELNIFLTPMYSWHRYNDFQFSINTSYESNKFYYEGYFDSNWVQRISCFTEQKFYYKAFQHFYIGTNLVFGASKEIVSFRPFLIIRVAI